MLNKASIDYTIIISKEGIDDVNYKITCLNPSTSINCTINKIQGTIGINQALSEPITITLHPIKIGTYENLLLIFNENNPIDFFVVMIEMSVVNEDFIYSIPKSLITNSSSSSTTITPFLITYYNEMNYVELNPSESEIYTISLDNILSNQFNRIFPFIIRNNTSILLCINIEYENNEQKSILRFSLTPRRKTFIETLYIYIYLLIFIFRMIPPNESYRIYPIIYPVDNNSFLYNEINIKFSCYNINSSIQICYKPKQIILSALIMNKPMVYNLYFYVIAGK